MFRTHRTTYRVFRGDITVTAAATTNMAEWEPSELLGSQSLPLLRGKVNLNPNMLNNKRHPSSSAGPARLDENPMLFAEVPSRGRDDRPLANHNLAPLSYRLPDVVFADELDRSFHAGRCGRY